MFKTALFDCAINEKYCSVDRGRGTCTLFTSPPRGDEKWSNEAFSWQEQYLTRSLRSLVRYCSCHSNIKFISSRHRVISSIYQNYLLEQRTVEYLSVKKPILGARMSATVSACLSLEKYFCSFSNKISYIS